MFKEHKDEGNKKGKTTKERQQRKDVGRLIILMNSFHFEREQVSTSTASILFLRNSNRSIYNVVIP